MPDSLPGDSGSLLGKLQTLLAAMADPQRAREAAQRDLRPMPLPYPGLRYHTAAISDMFVGREDQARMILDRLAGSQIVLILGGSGCGKSSLVRAGVLPLLTSTAPVRNRKGAWYSLTTRPERAPIDRLEAAFCADFLVPALTRLAATGKSLRPVAAVCSAAGTAASPTASTAPSPAASSAPSPATSTAPSPATSTAPSPAAGQDRPALPANAPAQEPPTQRSSQRLNVLEQNLPAELSSILGDAAPSSLAAEVVHRMLADAPGPVHPGLAEMRRQVETLDRLLTEDPGAEGANLLLVIDQFEELFRKDVDPQQRRRLMALIRYVFEFQPHGVFLVLVMRSEDLHRCAEEPGLPEIVNGSSVFVDWLDRAQLQRAIVYPAQRVFLAWLGLRPPAGEPTAPFAAEVVDTLLREAEELKAVLEHKGDHLPLLQHALQLLWGNAAAAWKAIAAQAARDNRDVAAGELRIDASLLEAAVAAARDAARKMPVGLSDIEVKRRKRLEWLLIAKAEEGLGAAVPIISAAGRWSSLLQPESVLKAAFCEMAMLDENRRYYRAFRTASEIIAQRLPPGYDRLREPLAAALNQFEERGLLASAGSDARDVTHEALIRNWPRLAAWVLEEKNIQTTIVRVVERRHMDGEQARILDPVLGLWRSPIYPYAWVRQAVEPEATAAFSRGDLRWLRLHYGVVKTRWPAVALLVFAIGLAFVYETKQAARTALIANVAIDQGDHGDARTAILLGLDAMKARSHLARLEVRRLQVVLARSLDGLIDEGPVFNRPGATIGSMLVTADERRMVVVTSDVTPAAAKTVAQTGPRTVQSIDLADLGENGVTQRLERGVTQRLPPGGEPSIAANGSAVVWENDARTSATVLNLNDGAQAVIPAPPGEQFDIARMSSDGSSVITVSTVQPDRPPATPATTPGGPAAGGRLVVRRWRRSRGKAWPTELPSPPVDNIDELQPVGDADVAISSSAGIWVFNSGQSTWHQVFRRSGSTEFGFASSLSSGIIGIANMLRGSASTGSQIEVQLLDAQANDPPVIAKFLVDLGASADIAPSGAFLPVVQTDGTLRILDCRLGSSTQYGTLRPAGEIRTGMRHLYVAHEGPHDEAEIERWRLPDLGAVETLPHAATLLAPPKPAALQQGADTKPDDTRLRPVVLFDPASATLSMIMNDNAGSVRIINARTGASLPNLQYHAHDVSAAAMLGDGSRLLVAGNWHLTLLAGGGGAPATFNVAGFHDFTAVAMTADGRVGAAGTDDGKLYLLALAKSGLVDVGPSELSVDNAIGALAFSADGTRILVAHGREAEVRNLANSGSQEGASVEFSADIKRVALDASGKFAAAAMPEGEVEVWDISSGGVLGRWAAGSPVVSIGFTADSHGVTVLTSAGKLATWTIRDPDAAEAEASELHLRPLTTRERARLQLP
ncbi:MAG TPA: hypothetical protein VMB34_18815 [Acetobacteraceae bacterium]|nr:hypothetical protein [Acetobacteraceae bacterium]